MQTVTKTPLQKLQELCDKCNRRYLAGLNDDDQVKAMFDYQKKHPELIVGIGYNTYTALTTEQVKKYASESSKIDEERTRQIGNVWIKFWHNGNIYSAQLLTSTHL